MNLSIQQLSDESAISASHISRIERGIRNPSPQTLKRLSEPLKVDYVTLLKLSNQLDNPKNECLDIEKALDESKTWIFEGNEVPHSLKMKIHQLLIDFFHSEPI